MIYRRNIYVEIVPSFYTTLMMTLHKSVRPILRMFLSQDRDVLSFLILVMITFSRVPVLSFPEFDLGHDRILPNLILIVVLFIRALALGLDRNNPSLILVKIWWSSVAILRNASPRSLHHHRHAKPARQDKTIMYQTKFTMITLW